MIRRRHVFYLEGYDPQGAVGYHALFAREWKRFRRLWPIEASHGDLVIDGDRLAHWDISATGPNWHVDTRYEFLRYEDVIGGQMAEPILRQMPRALGWIVGDIASGTMLRILRGAWRFALHLIFIQLLMLAWIAIAALAGWAASQGLGWLGGLAGPWRLALSIAVGLAVFLAMRPLADRWFVIQVTCGWPHLRRLARGAPTRFDAAIEAFATRIVAAVQAAEADEIVVVAHSGGGALAPILMARVLEIDPDVGRHGPALVVTTLGSIMPGLALHPRAARLREAVRRIAVEPSLTWIDVQARKDIMNFWEFDPVADVGVDAGPARCNPRIWAVRLRDMLAGERYARMRRSFFRLHFQYLMANDQRAPYDYLMMICGPAPFADWERLGAWTAVLAEDGAYVGGPDRPGAATADGA